MQQEKNKKIKRERRKKVSVIMEAVVWHSNHAVNPFIYSSLHANVHTKSQRTGLRPLVSALLSMLGPIGTPFGYSAVALA